MEKVTITLAEYERLLFKEEQIEQINVAADEWEEGDIDGTGFATKVLNIL